MIATLLSLSLLGCCYWWLYCAVRPARDTSDGTAALGLEDDPVRSPDAGGAWTALDELQLLRLLNGAGPSCDLN